MRLCDYRIYPSLLITVVATVAIADPPLFTPPHGLLAVEIDANDKLFSNRSAAGFNESNFTTNAAGHTILKHDLGGTSFEGGVTIFPGGIAERDGDTTSDPASTTSKKLLADDPGVFVGADTLPGENYVVSVNFLNSLRYFDGNAWTDPLNGEELRIFDLTASDETGGPAADLELVITEATSGVQGTINIGKTQAGAPPVDVTGVHGHMGYELSRPDGDTPELGAYMVELTLSATEFPSADGPVIGDSDPIFVVFDNQSDQINSDFFADAVSAAEALPEPSTALMVTMVGMGLLGTRRRRSTIASRKF